MPDVEYVIPIRSEKNSCCCSIQKISYTDGSARTRGVMIRLSVACTGLENKCTAGSLTGAQGNACCCSTDLCNGGERMRQFSVVLLLVAGSTLSICATY